MEKEYRIMEEDGYFFIQEKIYEDYSFEEACLNLFFIVPHRYKWSIVMGKCSKTLEEAKDHLIKITNKIEPKYHYL